MSAHQRNRLLRGPYVVSINLLACISLFILLELSYRIHRDGLREAFVNLVNNFKSVPYSSIGTGGWVISDSDLGYRLNPQKEGINSLSMRNEEIAIPKPNKIYRLIVLGDSISFDRPGLVSYTRDVLKQERGIEVINASVAKRTPRRRKKNA